MEPRPLSPPEPAVVYEDRHFLVVDKPAGLQVHAAKISQSRQAGGSRQASGHGAAAPQAATLVDWLVKRFPQIKGVGDDPALRPGIVHRLDKATSGIMVVAKDQDTFNYLKALFQKHEIKKTYLAVVLGVPKEKRGTIDAPIGIRSGTLKRSVRSAKMAKPALTEYRVAKTFEADGAGDARGAGARREGARSFSLLIVTPKTGRTHQIRVHLASIGHPVAGDRLYGPKAQPPWARRLMLHALSLEFTAPDGKRMKFESELSTPDFSAVPTAMVQ